MPLPKKTPPKKTVPTKTVVPKKIEPKKKEPVGRKTTNNSIPVYDLPDEIEFEEFEIDDFGILIYGPTGIGKSSLPQNADKPFYFRFEQSSRSLKVAKTPILTDWVDCLGWVAGAEKNKKGYKTMIIDTGAPAYDRCLEYICEKLGIEHPGRVKDFGASWKAVQNEFQKFFNRLAALDVGIWVMAHERLEENETRSGVKYSTIQPNFGGKTLEFFKSCMDIIGYYFYAGTERFMLIRGNEHVLAKCNLEDNFLTTSGERIIAIPMGNSSKESYSNFIKAYKNKQIEAYADIYSKGGIETVIPEPVKAVKKKPLKK